MKHSIKKIFLSLNAYMLFVMFASFIFMMLTLEKQLSFDKTKILNTQKSIILSLTNLKKDDLELALIQFNGKTAQLKSEIEKLYNIYKYSFTEKYILNNKTEYFTDLEKLKQLKDTFNTQVHRYYTQNKDMSIIKHNKELLQNTYYNLIKHLDKIISKDLVYSERKYKIFKYIFIATFFIILLETILYRKKINNIYADIDYLVAADKNARPYTIYSQEADAISLRMKRKTVIEDNPAFIDQITGISNYKGMVNSYANKRDMKDSNFTSITVIEIDNFSKSKRTYPQDVTQSILKKIAFTISLHEQAIDVVARTDYNQFTLILSRDSKEQAFKDVDIIRQSISEIKFNLPNNQNDTITITGGFLIKPHSTNLDEGIKQAKEILARAKNITKNRVLQSIDFTRVG